MNNPLDIEADYEHDFVWTADEVASLMLSQQCDISDTSSDDEFNN